MKVKKPILIESSFSEFVRKFGGRVLNDELGNNPTFQNADYVFDREKVVAELKCLEEDKLSDPEYLGKIEAILEKWKSLNLVESEPLETIWLDKLPQECAEELFCFASQAIARVVKKANVQIRDTKESLQLTNYVGLLLIANDGNFALPPNIIDKILKYVLAKKFSSIDYYVLFSVNMVTAIPGIDSPCTIWQPRGRTDTNPAIENFLNRLCEEWIAYRDNLLALPSQALGSENRGIELG